MFLHNRESTLFDDGRAVVLRIHRGPDTALTSPFGRGQVSRILGRFQGLSRREVAVPQGWKLAISEEALPSLEDDEFYVYQIEGAEVRLGDEVVGRVVRVHSTDVMDVLGSGTATRHRLCRACRSSWLLWMAWKGSSSCFLARWRSSDSSL